jgi:hypothetical protein
MISLTDYQLDVVAQAAGTLPVEKRGTFLHRVAGSLERPGPENHVCF